MTQVRWIWIGGWGVSPEWFRQLAQQALPSARHTVTPPQPDALANIDWAEFDRVGGYSLGAFLLLKHAGMITHPAVLLAPFFAFSAEAGLGGRIRQGQVRYLARWLKRDPFSAVADFYTRAQIDLPPPTEMPYDADDLAWGLDLLTNGRTVTRLPEDWTGFIGDQDPLIDAAAIVGLEPKIEIVAGADHHPALLLQAVASHQ